MSSKINDKFWAAVDNSDVFLVRKYLNQHRSYLTKINSPVSLVKSLMSLQQYSLALGFYKRPEIFKKKVAAKDYLVFRCFESSYYLSQDCYLRALHIVNDLLQYADESNKEWLIVYKGDVYLMQDQFDKALICYKQYLDNNWEKVQSFSLVHNYILCLIYLKRFEEAQNVLPRLTNLANDPLKEIANQVVTGLFCFYTESTDLLVLKEKYSELLQKCCDENLKCKISHLLGMVAQKKGENSEAVLHYLNACAVEGIPPKTAVLDNYRPLYDLGYPLTAEQQVSLFCYPSLENEVGGEVFQLKAQKFQKCDYHPNQEQDNYVDLVSGRYCITGKVQWLTKLQARFMLALISSGEVGQHVCNLESLVFDSDNQNRINGIKRVEVMLVYMKRLGFNFTRKNNFVYFNFNPTLNYIIPTNMNYQGPMAILHSYDYFGRVDLEKLLFVKKSVAADMIKKWIEEERVYKRPDLGANTYSVKPYRNDVSEV